MRCDGACACARAGTRAAAADQASAHPAASECERRHVRQRGRRRSMRVRRGSVLLGGACCRSAAASAAAPGAFAAVRHSRRRGRRNAARDRRAWKSGLHVQAVRRCCGFRVDLVDWVG
eukprot:46235-Chlamydomonas_euryale.AAC.1